MCSRGAKVIPQLTAGMGNARRQAIREAVAIALPKALPLVWLEPEKAALVPHLSSALAAMEQKSCNMVMFNRRSLASYPPEQVHAYTLVRLMSQYVLGEDLDFLFGPLLFDAAVAEHLLAYGGEYSDNWDSIHVPKLRAMRAGLTYHVEEIDYTHPAEQTQCETGDMDLFIKRIEQVCVVARAILRETRTPLQRAHSMGLCDGQTVPAGV